MLVSCLERTVDERKNVDMLLLIETNFTSVQPGGPVHPGSLIGVYTVCKQTLCIIVTSVDAADAQADLSVPCPHMS